MSQASGGSSHLSSYVYTFGAFASAISSALNLPAGPIYQAFDTSVHFDSSESYVFDVFV